MMRHVTWRTRRSTEPLEGRAPARPPRLRNCAVLQEQAPPTASVGSPRSRARSAVHASALALCCAGGLLLVSCSGPDVASAWVAKTPAPPALTAVEFGEPSAPGAAGAGVADRADASAADADAPGEAAPLATSIRDAVLVALQQNPAFQVERLTPAIRHTYETQERAVFDPTLTADASRGQEHDESETETGGASADLLTRSTTRSAGVGIQQAFPTGTVVEVSARRTLGNTRGDPDDAANYDNLSATNAYDLTITQALLEGFGPAVNLARLRQARLDTRISRYQLEAAAETLVYQTEATGWDYLLAQRQIQIYEDSLALAEEQLKEVRERIRVGALADIEAAAVQAEVAKRKEDLINARSMLAKTRLKLFRLLGENGAARWRRDLTLSDAPEVPADPLAPPEQHVAVALKQRPDLNEARLRIERGELDVVRTRNGLLPQLDFFITLGGSRYARSFGSTGRDEDGRTEDVEAGLSLNYALGHRSERAAHRRSQWTLDQTREALRNQEDLAQVDVRTAYLEVQRTAEQIEATAATRNHREQSLRSESEKFRVGKSTSILVAQAQRDLVASRIAEIQAVIQHIKARLDLYRQEGSLLERRGIGLDAP